MHAEADIFVQDVRGVRDVAGPERGLEVRKKGLVAGATVQEQPRSAHACPSSLLRSDIAGA